MPIIIRNLFAGLLFFAATLAATAQNYTWSNVRIGGTGNITSIQADTAVPNLFFATTDVGNCYKWNATTGAWMALMNWVPPSQWNNAACENIAYDPNDSTGNILYATVGKFANYTYSWAPEGKVIKSIDGGNTWADAGLAVWVSANGQDKSGGERLGVDPQNSSVVYLTTYSGGTYRGTSGGTVWTQINNINGRFIAFDVSGGTVNGVTKNIFLGTSAGVYLSTDGGNTFALSGSSSVAAERASISKNGTMYVATSTDVLKWNGSAWSTVTPASGSYHAVAVDPNNSSNVIASIGTWDSPTYLSSNGGSTWTLISGATYDMSEVPWMNGNGWNGKGINDFAWDPYNTGAVWFGDEFELWQTTNVWASPVAWKAQAVGEEESVTDGTLLAPPSGSQNVLLSSVADVGGFDHHSITAPPATAMANYFPYIASLNGIGDMTGVAVEQINPSFIVRVGRTGWNGPSYAGYSTNSGASYTVFSTYPATGAGGVVAVSANSQTIVWAPQGGYVYRSTDLGSTWTQITSLPQNVATGSDIFSGNGNPLAADKVNGNKFYVYNGGKIYVSTDGGVTFVVAATLTSSSPGQVEVEATPGIEGDLWVSLQTAGLFHSTNSGATFTQISNVQDAELMAVGAAANTTPAVYVMGEVNSTIDGVFRSDDAGNTWTEIDTPAYKMGDSPNAMAADLSTYGRVYIGTNGDGIFVGSDSSGGSTTVPAAPTGLTATSSTAALQINLSWTASSTAGVVYNVYRGTTSGFTPSSSNLIANGLYSTFYTDTAVSESTTYYYVVVASTSAGSSPASSQASATTLTLTGPAAPTGLTATSSTTALQINLSWTASSTSGVTYNVFRSTASGFTPSSGNQITSGVTGTAYADTAVSLSTTYYYVVEASNTTGSSWPSSQASATTIASVSSASVIAIDAGGPAAGNYAADEYVSGGSLSTPTGAPVNVVGVANPAPQEVYQTQRWGAMTYTIPGLTAGTQYTVTLQFNDMYWTKAGQRQFNVILNGTQVLTNFDIIGATGGQNIAIAKSFMAIANSSGQIVIQFTVGAADQPTIGGIEVNFSGIAGNTWYQVINKNSNLCVEDTGSANSAAVDQVACVSGQSSQAWEFTPTSNGYYTVTSMNAQGNVWDVIGGTSATAPGTLIDSYGYWGGTNQQWMPVPLGNGYYKFVVLNSGLCLDDPNAQTASGVQLDIATCNGSAEQAWQVVVPPVVAIDAGGPALGNYAANEYVSGGSPSSTTNAINTTFSIDPAPQEVYQTQEYGAMTYTIPGLTAGAPYTVTLRFAEKYATAAGQRQFNVILNGTQVLTNYDIFVDAGGEYIATDRSFTATANNSGQIVIQFTAVVGNPIVSAITVQ
ncbi:MAG: malectin domain-containing carbohydrate-binding protein [Acidobacteriaceae bacterium]